MAAELPDGVGDFDEGKIENDERWTIGHDRSEKIGDVWNQAMKKKNSLRALV